MPKQIREAAAAPQTAAPGRIKIGLITPGWGSSGYYPQKVLEAAGTDKVWPAGTHVFFDHPSESEMFERPERSVRDIAAVTIEDAHWDGTGLVAEAKVIGPYRDLVTDPVFAEAVGMSIRASAEQTAGEAEGRKGMIIDRLVEGISVDLVTKAGRGGKVLAVLESSRAEARETFSRETRDLLDLAVGDGCWVVDFDPDTSVVVYRREWQEAGDYHSDLVRDTYTVTDGAATLAGSPEQVRQTTGYEPVPAGPAQEGLRRPPATDPTNIPPLAGTHVPAPAGRSNATESKETTMATTQIEEAELGRLREDSQRVQAAESARDAANAERDTARNELAVFRAREAARPAIATRVAESGLPARRQTRIVESVLATITADTTDPATVAAATEAAVTDAEADMAEIAEALGVGKVRGLGAGTTDAGEVSEADYRAAMYGTEQKGA